MGKQPSAKRKTAGARKVASGSGKTPRKRAAPIRPTRQWSARVTQGSDALDLESGIFSSRSPDAIARSLKRSAERSKRRKGSVRQSATSMLNFYMNRAGRNLSMAKRRILEKAKVTLKGLFENEKGK